MSTLIAICGIGLSLWLMHRLGLWMESKGWIYYKSKPKAGGGFGNALDELNRCFRPSYQHVQEVKKKARKEESGVADDL